LRLSQAQESKRQNEADCNVRPPHEGAPTRSSLAYILTSMRSA
jgi:hypothetical protein